MNISYRLYFLWQRSQTPPTEYFTQPLTAINDTDNLNYITFQGDTRPCLDAFAEIQDKIISVSYYDAETSSWKMWNPTAPDWGNDFTIIEKLKDYVIKVSEDCLWVYPLTW